MRTVQLVQSLGRRAPAAPHRIVDGLAAHTRRLGELMPEVAPPHLPGTEAAGALVPPCDARRASLTDV
ncbi:hypothetical protein OG520_01450 [Streptomyces sp. NBC_00984]|uniref:hypothetical protein n=1 Tax=Streptomyces sp. NBC_00984 TaxID=2903700 RepID=UPI003869496E|nr:hypothetical protein OG520_01450 [Streptomyces sp. NBC_00984]